MASKRRRSNKRNRGSQMRFEDSDFQWLAERFQKQVEKNPDLTLEEFAAQHAVEAKWIRRFLPEDERFNRGKRGHVLLLHGTTADRAKAILEDGFKSARSSGRKIWFTRHRGYAVAIAKRRSSTRGEPPVVLSCQIDLSKYPEYEQRQAIYAFDHAYIAKEVVVDVSSTQEAVRKMEEENQARKKKDAVVDLTITATSGTLGVLWWINSYLEIEDRPPVAEDDPVVGAIWQWVEAQYADGREEAISDEEMLMQVAGHLK